MYFRKEKNQQQKAKDIRRLHLFAKNLLLCTCLDIIGTQIEQNTEDFSKRKRKRKKVNKRFWIFFVSVALAIIWNRTVKRKLVKETVRV